MGERKMEEGEWMNHIVVERANVHRAARGGGHEYMVPGENGKK